jgi:anaerobic selenocysteine-containing dehydrogenase
MGEFPSPEGVKTHKEFTMLEAKTVGIEISINGELTWVGTIKITDTICRMCGRYCPINVKVEDGKVVKIEGIPDNFVTKGRVCGKGIAAIQLEYDPKRLKYPMKRTGERGAGEWARITWDEALEIISRELLEKREEYGARAVVYHYGAAIQHVWPYIRRLMNLFGSPNVAGHDHLCHVPRVLAQTATYGGMPQPDYDNTELMMLWGYNPIYSSILHYGRQIIDAREKGAKLIVVDPIFTSIASKADIFVQPRPGSDGALGLGMLNVIIHEGLYDRDFVARWTFGFEELKELVQGFPPQKVEEITWVPADLIREVARTYATTKPAVLEEGNGLDQHTNVVQTVRVLAILRAVTGNLGIVGGHVFRPSCGLADIILSEKMPRDVESITQNPLYTGLDGTISTPHVIDALLTGKPYPIKAMIVQGSGAGVIASNSDEALKAFKKLDLLVVDDIFMTATAEIADIVLPAATFLEQSCLVQCPGAGPSPTVDTCFVGLMNKVVEPLAECWSDHKFVFELAKRLGYGKYFTTPEDLFNEELAPIDLSVEKLREHPGGVIRKLSPDELYMTFEIDGFGTPTGKVELHSKMLEDAGYDPLPHFKEPAESPFSRPEVAEKYPLVCGTGLHLGLFTHNQYRTLPWLKELIPEAFVEIHPERAEELDIANGDEVFVESMRGRIRVAAKVTEEVDPRVVMVAWGWGQPYASGDRTNLITDGQERCPVSGSTGNRSLLCRVMKA